MSARSRWAAALSLAALRGVTPEAFWKLSIPEWRALAVPAAPPTLSRADLDTLMRTYSDR